MSNNPNIPFSKILIRILSCLFLFITAFSCTHKSNQAQKGGEYPKPNILYILADDLGSYGQTNIQTPNLDRMGAEGMRFTQHYAGSMVCAPSRSVLMTGLHTGHTPVRGNREYMPVGQHPLPYAATTVAEVLGEAGYVTGAFGKWELGYPGSEGVPARQGFDEFFGYLGQRRARFYYPKYLYRDTKAKALQKVPLAGNKANDDPGHHPGSGPPVTRGVYSQDVITEEALCIIEENSGDPFFLYLSFTIPHASLVAPDEAMELYLDSKGESIFRETPFPGGHYTGQPTPRAAYAAMVTRLDGYVGKILDRLAELEIAQNTLVIFSSGNESHTAGGSYSMHNSNEPLQGGKRDLYEGGIRVPMIAWWPRKMEAGSTSEHISGFQDILPTFAELAGTKAPANINGAHVTRYR